jgi:hypothetical protein
MDLFFLFFFFLVLRFLAKNVSFLHSDKVAGGSVPGISTISTSLLAGYIMVHARMTVLEKIMHQGPYTPKYDFLAAARSRDRALSVPMSHTAKHAISTALLDPITRC